MKRREFITLLGVAAVACPLAARAQGERVRRIGALVGGAETDPESRGRVAALREGLGQRGWSEGRNLRIDYRWGGADPERMRALATELVTTAPEVISPTPLRRRSDCCRPRAAYRSCSLRCRIRLATASSRASRVQEATSPASPMWKPRSAASGWRSSRRWRRGSRVWDSCSVRPPRPAADRISCGRSRPLPRRSM